MNKIDLLLTIKEHGNMDLRKVFGGNAERLETKRSLIVPLTNPNCLESIMSTKQVIEQALTSMGHESRYISRAFKVYEKNYGQNYNAEVLMEIIKRLENKDKAKSSLKDKPTAKQRVTDSAQNNNQSPPTHQYPRLSANKDNKHEIAEFEPKSNKNDENDFKGDEEDHAKDELMEEYRAQTTIEVMTDNIQNPQQNIDKSSMPLFKSHMQLQDAVKLKVHDKIDHRDNSGRFINATVTEKQGTNLKIHYVGCDYYEYGLVPDVWSDFQEELYRFAKPGSISNRPAHRFKELKKGDHIDINPTRTHYGWKCGEIQKLDQKSGQVQVAYEFADESYLYWAHLDNKQEIAEFRSKANKNGGNNFNDEELNHLKDELMVVTENMDKTLNSMGSESGHVAKAFEIYEVRYIFIS